MPPLPFRPLELRANGVYDPERKTFYPFRLAYRTLSSSSGGVLAAKPGICYFVHSVTLSAYNEGDTAGGVSHVYGTVNGASVAFGLITLETTTAAGLTHANATTSQVVDVLCDPNTAVNHSVAAYRSACSVVYAEIPVDTEEYG